MRISELKIGRGSLDGSEVSGVVGRGPMMRNGCSRESQNRDSYDSQLQNQCLHQAGYLRAPRSIVVALKICQERPFAVDLGIR